MNLPEDSDSLIAYNPVYLGRLEMFTFSAILSVVVSVSEVLSVENLISIEVAA